MSQMQGGGAQESIPPATQSTSRKENNTTTGIVYTQSSHHPIQSQQHEQSETKNNKAVSKNCIVIDDESDSDHKEKYSSQPVGTQPFSSSQSGEKHHIFQTEKKHRLSRRSRSRNALDQEQLFKEVLAEKKEKEFMKHQANLQEPSSNIHLSELERTVQKVPAPAPTMAHGSSKVTSLFSSGKKTPKTSRHASSSNKRRPVPHTGHHR